MKSSLSFYNTIMKGVQSYHNKALGNITINGNKIKAPPKIQLNDNISTMQHAILDSYTSSTYSSNETLRKTYGKSSSIMHEGIQKFTCE